MLNRNAVVRWLLSWPRWIVGTAWVEFVTSRLCTDSGFESFAGLDRSRGVLVVANHRSFFDLFVISARLYRKFGNHRYICFPVRSTFFYSSPFGLSVNLPVAQAAMYPPIFREKEKRELNRFSMDLLVELLRDPAYMIGFHPEGTRNQGPDPYTLLRGKPGTGELIHRGHPHVIPIFLQGFPRFAWFGAIQNRLPRRFRPTWVHMVMGAPMDFSAEQALEGTPEVYQRIADKVMAELHALGQRERVERAASARGAA